MTIPINFSTSPNVEEVFLDESGLALTGELRTFSDVNRATPKSIFVISGSPPNYTVTPLPNPTPISAGKLQDGSGNSVTPLYNMVDGGGNPEAYFLQVFDSNTASVIETRECWPQGALTGGESELLHAENFIPNGQFRFNNEIAANPSTGAAAGEITQANTHVAIGGWAFNRPPSSTAQDFITFFRYPQFVSNPSASPRFAIDVVNTSPDATDTFKDLRVKWEDVNKFASVSQKYTFWFNAESLDATTRNVSIVMIRRFGTGGTVSLDEELVLANFDITAGMNSYSLDFPSGIPDGNNIGTDNNDTFSLALRFPQDSIFSIRITDVVLVEGVVTILKFPVSTDRDFISRSAIIPESRKNDGSTLYLPLISTKAGLIYDDSTIGRVESFMGNEVPVSVDSDTNLLLCDGESYLKDGYSPLGIPFSRLGDKLFNVPVASNTFGNGPNFVDIGAEDPQVATQFFLSPNQKGAAANATDSLPATGFGFKSVCTGVAGGFGYNSYYGILAPGFPAMFAMISDSSTGLVTAPDGSDVGFSVFVKSLLIFPMWQITVVNATGFFPGGFFTFSKPPNDYYGWFTIDGAGVDPAPGGIGIQIDLLSTWSDDQVALSCYAAVRGSTQTSITTTAAAAFVGGANFLFSTVTNGDWYVWYTKDGGGSDPNHAGRTGIQVDVLSADTAAQVCFKTITALNSVYFSVPDARGMFLKGMGTQFSDDDTEFSQSPISPDLLAQTMQMQELASHTHSYPFTAVAPPTAPGVSLVDTNILPVSANSNARGGVGTRPTNIGVYYKIRY